MIARYRLIAVGLSCVPAVLLFTWTVAGADRAARPRPTDTHLVAQVAPDQQPGTPGRSATADRTDKQAQPRIRPRLPRYYAQLELTPQQKQQVYAIYSQYQEKLMELRAELDRLAVEREQKYMEVLTTEQQQKLDTLTQQARLRRSVAPDSDAPQDAAATSDTARVASGARGSSNP